MSSELDPDMALRIRDLGKTYRRVSADGASKSLRDELKKIVQPHTWRSRRTEDFVALDSVSFDVKRGERLAILGNNGAGKSTLLKLLCRVSLPSTGTILFRGSIASILEVGTGFHPDLSGRENVYLNGAIMGLTRDQINLRFPNIVSFADIGEFIDQPVKHYSSGMYVRLAFSIAAHLDPDILIIDEVLAVGDVGFRRKCLERMKNFTNDACRTVILVSHDLEVVKEFSSRCILIHSGRLIFDGTTKEAIDLYLSKT